MLCSRLNRRAESLDGGATGVEGFESGCLELGRVEALVLLCGSFDVRVRVGVGVRGHEVGLEVGRGRRRAGRRGFRAEWREQGRGDRGDRARKNRWKKLGAGRPKRVGREPTVERRAGEEGEPQGRDEGEREERRAKAVRSELAP